MANGPGSPPCGCGGTYRTVVGKNVQFSLRQVNGSVRGDRWGYRPDLAECSDDPGAYVYSEAGERRRLDVLKRKGWTVGCPIDELERKMKYPSEQKVAAEKAAEQSNRELAQALVSTEESQW